MRVPSARDPATLDEVVGKGLHGGVIFELRPDGKEENSAKIWEKNV